MLYYFYTQAFGVEVLIMDIIILFVSILFGQLLAFHFYKHSKGINAYIPIYIFIFFNFNFYDIYSLSTTFHLFFRDGEQVNME